MKHIYILNTSFTHLLIAVLFATTGLGYARADRDALSQTENLDDDTSPVVSDPIRGVNRSIFRFNDKAYTHIVKPIARGYQRVVPRFARVGLNNFFDNLKFPVRLVGSLLQAKVKRASQETEKFAINSSIGVCGFIRMSDKVHSLVAVPEEDIGQAFGSWGIHHGPYIIIPIIGPKSTRDLIGSVAGGLLNPVSWLNLAGSASIPIDFVDTIHSFPEEMHVYDTVTNDALDPYIAARNAYISHRNAEVAR